VVKNNDFSLVEKLRGPWKMDLQLFAGESGEGSGGSGGGFSAAYVQELRDEAASWRIKLRAAEEELREQKGLVETATTKLQKIEEQNSEFLDGIYESLGLDKTKVSQDELPGKIKEALSKSNAPIEKAQDALKKSAFISAAVKAGIRKEALDDAFKLADFSNVKVDLDTMTVFPTDKDGNQLKDKDTPITGLDSIVSAMVKEKPWLVGKTAIGSPSNPGGGGSSEDDGDSFGESLGKKRSKQMNQFKDSQKHYFG